MTQTNSGRCQTFKTEKYEKIIGALAILAPFQMFDRAVNTRLYGIELRLLLPPNFSETKN